ncbi:LuxR C-terminal-related transcriptional regulator [Alkalibacillus salilacus]
MNNGKKVKQSADIMEISANSVETHLRN